MTRKIERYNRVIGLERCNLPVPIGEIESHGVNENSGASQPPAPYQSSSAAKHKLKLESLRSSSENNSVQNVAELATKYIAGGTSRPRHTAG